MLSPEARMAENKTRPTHADVDAFLAAVEPPARRDEARRIDAWMREISGLEPVLWGPSIVGYGTCHYRYDSGREGDMPRIAFSPRKGALTLYLLSEDDGYDALLARLGPHERSVACLYVKKLDKVDGGVLREIIARTWVESARR
jgi:hypothetical protein